MNDNNFEKGIARGEISVVDGTYKWRLVYTDNSTGEWTESGLKKDDLQAVDVLEKNIKETYKIESIEEI